MDTLQKQTATCDKLSSSSYPKKCVENADAHKWSYVFCDWISF